MIVGFGAATASVCTLSGGAISPVTDLAGEFLALDTGAFIFTGTSKYVLTNTELQTLQTGTSLNFLTDTSDTLVNYVIDGETTSAPDPE